MLKSCDFFRKIQTEQQFTSTTGGVFTTVALIAAAVLIIFSVQDYMEQEYYTFLSVQNDQSSFLPMRLDILFDKMPCHSIQIQYSDKLEYVQSDLETRLKMQQYLPTGQPQPYIRSQDRSRQKELLLESLKEGRQCRLSGVLPIPKTPGIVTFKPTAQNNLLEEVSHDDARMSYRLTTLQFGWEDNSFKFPISHQSESIARYITELEGDINTRPFVQDYTKDNEMLNYLSHIKIIPVSIKINSEENKTQIEKNQTQQKGEKYRYSIRSAASKVLNYRSAEVLFFSELQPIHIIYSKTSASLYELLVSILAIVGGTVATIGLFNSLSQAILKLK